MIGLRILGAQGSRTSKSNSTCIQVSKNTLIDAGNIIQGLGDECIHIDNIFLSHSHLDHILDIAFLIDNFFEERKKPLRIFALQETIDTIKNHIFNWEIWPDFSEINLSNTNAPAIEFIAIEFYKEYRIEDDITLIPIPSVHTVPTAGYIIQKPNSSILFSADTFKNKDLWDLINKDKKIKALIIDVSFPNELSILATNSKHLTAKFLQEEMKYLKRSDVKIYINHIKPFYKDKIIEELEEIGIYKKNILNDSEILSYTSGNIIQNFVSNEEKINKLNKIGEALSSETCLDDLMEMIVSEAKSLTHADGGTLYMVEDDKLKFTLVQNDSLDINMQAKRDGITWPDLPFYLENEEENKKMVAVVCALEGRVINIPNVYKAKGFLFDGTKAFDKETGYKSKSMLVIPLKNHENKVIGVLQLINKQNILYEEVESFNKEDEEITLSLGSQAALAITNVTLIDGLEKLLEAFLKSIIFAMGKKSAHTAGHIKRMVELSIMIAAKVDKDVGVYKDKNYSQEEIKQINFAALMHDIGKLATPEQIIDKGKKLETIFDRVELIKIRIELIQKELELELFKENITRKYFEEEITLLNNYWEFIEKNNTGSEFLPNEAVKKIEDIKEKTYTFNDKKYFILTKDEAYNLSIQKGTITNEERDIINNHAKLSLQILRKLPFPKKYERIPEISGNHHEKINGKGYPQGLKGDEISFEARILAIADIFEALTASDRPYKKANKLSTAMQILYFMAKDNELDKGLVKFFYSSGLYLEYANKLLPKNSIDEVNIDFDSL